MTVRRIAEKIRKKAARGLALGLCLGLLSAGRLTSYADGPSGPASDGAAVAAESAKEAQAEGPAQNMETESVGQAETGGQPEGAFQENQQDAHGKHQSDIGQGAGKNRLGQILSALLT